VDVPDRPHHARVALTTPTRLSSKATTAVRAVADRLVADPKFLENPDAVVSADVEQCLTGKPEHVLAAAELAVLSACAQRISGLNDLESMRLQMAIDRRAKFLQGLSNALKRTSSASDAIAANLK